VRALSHVFFFSTLVRCGEYRSQTGIQRKLNFVSVRTIKEGSSLAVPQQRPERGCRASAQRVAASGDGARARQPLLVEAHRSRDRRRHHARNVREHRCAVHHRQVSRQRPARDAAAHGRESDEDQHDSHAHDEPHESRAGQALPKPRSNSQSTGFLMGPSRYHNSRRTS
jgi:hypothetical protein